ncbi:hypothetical protein GCM10010289_75810 [Streptomyces violascens]|uniref:Nudix hydrolase domain-containing protein n=2 Tax=Streptomyces violascens TaxID=67381 RepID=A0ABQ3QV45_9ACTN|nr:hypothetical protein GCM10010289_75810 [Streptomyces violascens]GHI41148.1 hypothetical protein Sviol_55560 [Streptomyces violascens]
MQTPHSYPLDPSTSNGVMTPSPVLRVTSLVMDAKGRIGLLERDGAAVLPGGVVCGGESPEATLARHLAAQFGAPIPVGRLLAVDSLPAAEDELDTVVHLHFAGPLTTLPVTPRWTASGRVRWEAPEIATHLLAPHPAGQVRAALAAWWAGSVAHLVAGIVQPGSAAGLSPVERASLEEANALDPASYRAVRPKVICAATVLLPDAAHRVLLVQPAYHTENRWQLPGGGIDSDVGESPRTAARREVREELGLDLPLGRLLAVNWANDTPHPSRVGFTFSGPVLGESDLARIRIPPREIRAWRMVAEDELVHLVGAPLRERVAACLTALRHGSGPLELHDGTLWQ